MSHENTFKVGDPVTYRDVNLWYYQGVVVSVGPTEHGGDCTVRWQDGVTTEEWSPNLKRREDGS